RAGGRHIGPGPRRMRRQNRRRPPRPSPRSAATTPRAAAAPTAPPWPGAGAGSTVRRGGPDAPVRGRRYHAGAAPRPPAAGGPATDSTGPGAVPALRTLGGPAVVDAPTGNPIGFKACAGSTAEVALRSNAVGIAVEPRRAMGPTRSGPRSATSILSAAAAPGT